LISWDRIRYLRSRTDYGYGINYNWNYGYNTKYFFDYVAIPSEIAVKTDVKVETIVVDKSDPLCSYWDDGKCIACYGDYYADNSGRCVRIEDECEFWRVSGNCSKCSYGYIADSRGKCVISFNAIIVRY